MQTLHLIALKLYSLYRHRIFSRDHERNPYNLESLKKTKAQEKILPILTFFLSTSETMMTHANKKRALFINKVTQFHNQIVKYPQYKSLHFNSNLILKINQL